ncbi:MAG: NAD-dependent epimerase/dehydratase family protein [Deltaproteobacteria bacterium]|nr:NAD-dependent epimerase/dehydratase family protein [Deltaproteobacteria bacterium]MCB9785240.1 NAD-dependent epimerase/dehydratase family protein [Deltaproteobacteria bacterium]
MAKVLITGIAGSLAQLAALELMRRGDSVIGVDYRSKPVDLPRGIVFSRASYNKSGIVDLYRRHRPDLVLHLGRVGNLRVRPNQRFDLNVVGSAKIQELSLEYGVKQLVVLSTYHIYGAHPYNHSPILEDEPVRALQTVPELADATQLDGQAVTFAYRHPQLSTIVLRPTNVIGPHINNTTCRYLRARTIPYVSGFNPMWQFLYETDMLRALLAALDSGTSGVFNLTGRGSLPIVEALKLTGGSLLPVPSPLIWPLRRLADGVRSAVPPYLVDFLKYPVIVSDERFRGAFAWEPRIGIPEAIRSTISRMPLTAGLG